MYHREYCRVRAQVSCKGFIVNHFVAEGQRQFSSIKQTTDVFSPPLKYFCLACLSDHQPLFFCTSGLTLIK